MTATAPQEFAYDKSASDLQVKVFADGADRASMLESYANPLVSGFTTNPTLMRRAGVTDYRAFAHDIVAAIPDRHISFEVFSDEFEDMERQAREIATWGDNVYAKIPITNTKGQTSCEMVKRLSQDGVKVNVTAIFLLDQVREVARGQVGETPNQCQAGLYVTTAADFLADPALQEEVFGSTSLVIECQDAAEVKRVADRLEGQLTITLQMDDADHEAARVLLPTLERKAGRIMANGWPTGVEVCHAMVHGGPFPATSDSRTTSVGSAAIHRFLRPVCYQNLPQALLPEALRDGNPLNVSQLVDGKRHV